MVGRPCAGSAAGEVGHVMAAAVVILGEGVVVRRGLRWQCRGGGGKGVDDVVTRHRRLGDVM